MKRRRNKLGSKTKARSSRNNRVLFQFSTESYEMSAWCHTSCVKWMVPWTLPTKTHTADIFAIIINIPVKIRLPPWKTLHLALTLRCVVLQQTKECRVQMLSVGKELQQTILEEFCLPCFCFVSVLLSQYVFISYISYISSFLSILLFTSFFFCCLPIFLHPKKTICRKRLFPYFSSYWWVYLRRFATAFLFCFVCLEQFPTLAMFFCRCSNCLNYLSFF